MNETDQNLSKVSALYPLNSDLEDEYLRSIENVSDQYLIIILFDNL